MYNRTTPHSMQNAELCTKPPEAHVIRICFSEAGRDWFYELAKRPPCGISSIRFNELLDDFSYALQKRMHANRLKDIYQSPEERSVHAEWYSAHADALETDAKLARTLAKRLGGSPCA